MRIGRGHARHPMAEERLSYLIIDAEALQPGGERVSKIMKMQILDLCQLAHASPVLLERSTSFQRRNTRPSVIEGRGSCNAQGRGIEGKACRGSL